MIHNLIQRYNTFFMEIDTYHNPYLILMCILRYMILRFNNTYIFNYFLYLKKKINLYIYILLEEFLN